MRRALVSLFVILALTACEKTVKVFRVDGPGIEPIAVELPSDDSSVVGWYPTLRMGPDGSIHIAYCDYSRGDARYGHRDASGELKLESISEHGAVGKYLTMAIDEANSPHVLFHNQDTKYLMYAARVDGVWQEEKVAWGPEMGMGSRMLMHAGELYAIFYDAKEHFKLANRKPLADKPMGSEDAWKVENVDEAGGGWSVWTDLIVHDNKLIAVYPHFNFVDAELRLGQRTLGSTKWETRVLFPFKKRSPGWSSSLVVIPGKGLHLAFSTIYRERIFYGPIPENIDDDMVSTPVVGFFLNRMRTRRADNGDIVMAVAETGKGSLGNSTMAIIRFHDDKWQRYTFDARRQGASQMDLVLGPKGEAIVLYFDDKTRGLWLYDETKTATRIVGARPSPVAKGSAAASSSPTSQPQSGPSSAPTSQPAQH